MLPLLLLPGCLSNPTPLGGPSGSDGSLGTAFPPPGAKVGIFAGQVVDLDGDGKDDVVLTSVTGDSASQGFYVLRGRAAGLGTVLDAFVNTPTAQPWAVAVDDVNGDGKPDVLILGDDLANSKAHLLAYPGLSATTFGDPLSKEVTTELSLPPSYQWHPFVTRARFSAAALGDVILSDGANVFTGEIPGWDQATFETMPLAVVPGTNGGGPSFYNSVAATTLPNGTAYPDLLIADFNLPVWFENTGGSYVFSSAVAHRYAGTPEVDHAWVGFFDLNGDGATDILGMWLGDLSAVTTKPVPLTSYTYDTDRLQNNDNTTTGMAVANLDANPKPEVIVIDDDDMMITQGGMVILENVYLMNSKLVSDTTALTYLFDPGFHPTVVLVGDFNGDGTQQIMVFDKSGLSICLKQIPGDRIAKCP